MVCLTRREEICEVVQIWSSEMKEACELDGNLSTTALTSLIILIEFLLDNQVKPDILIAAKKPKPVTRKK